MTSGLRLEAIIHSDRGEAQAHYDVIACQHSEKRSTLNTAYAPEQDFVKYLCMTKSFAFAMTVGLSASLAMSTAICEPAHTDARLVGLLMKMGLRESVTAWCGGELQPGRSDVYAIGLGKEHGEGEYLVVADGVPPTLLSSYYGQPDLACLSPADARGQDETIRSSEGISGSITPQWSTTIVCGFVDETSVTCWQFSPDAHTFVEVGGWVT